MRGVTMPINEYGIYVRALRKKNNQNLNDMAKLMGVSISFLSAMEVGTKTMPLDIADRVGSWIEFDEKQV